MTGTPPVPAALPRTLRETVQDLPLPTRLRAELAATTDAHVLLGAAVDLRESDPDSARALLDALRAHAPDPAHRQYATHALADLLHGQGRPDEAARLIDGLLDSGRLDRGLALILAEDFTATGALDRALHCYNIACRSILAGPAETVAGLDRIGLVPLLGRAAVRERLGLTPDGHDLAAREADRHRPDAASEPRRLSGDVGADLPSDMFDRPFPEADEPRPLPETVRENHAFFPSPALAEARERGLLPADTDPAAHHHGIERTLRAQARGFPDVHLGTIAVTPDEITAFAAEHGLDPADPGTLRAWISAVPDPGSPRVTAWPPERNHPCWCGSTRKYKKCCGSPSLR
ncbi:SEC-C metal-binding domain-containing protein [Nocardiopsis sp. N85]|uniref:SEC-C metal-binding domain-containing protein n=1 Tax=Nocardiopsis sp. N85 TaxID=3029400 RepID=UPI00237F084D|nr:SEC-C metal-binding domain-containing protein [Nocardiopsis sp. N85]MDE3720527.1 SEC-C metal-binding domain-containing protein [Nocardiopsis sp. N85]